MADRLEPEQLYQIIRRATEEVFTTMLALEVKAGEPYVEQAAPGNFAGVVAFIGLTGAWAGTGSVSCGSPFACRLSSCFLMTEFPAVDEQVLDAMGELTNMIIGNVKNEVEERLGPMGMSIPTVIHGHNFSARSVGRDEWTVVPFWSGEDRLNVKICLTPKGQTAQDSGTRARALILP
jgi:chemotaxis protein CheX